MKWEEALKLIQDDKRFNVFPSGGEKRQMFGEYLNRKQREEKENTRKRRQSSRDDMLALLRTNINGSIEIKPSTKFRDVYEWLAVHECWEYLENDDERDEVFQ